MRADSSAAEPAPTRHPAPAGAAEPAEVMDVIEAAAFLHVAPSTVRTALAAKRLPGKRIGKEWRLSRTALLAWLASPGEAKNYPKRGPARRTTGKD